MPFPRSALNVPGPFYSTGECMACGAPEDEAPDLLAEITDQQLETHFIRQPSTPEEIERACRAAEVCCVSAIRYAGDDFHILRRLGNSELYCDCPTQGGRTRVPPGSNHDEEASSFVKRAWLSFWTYLTGRR